MLGIPVAFVVVGGLPADQSDHPVAAGAQERGQRGADQAGGPGDRDGEGDTRQHTGGVGVRVEVVGQLAVPVGERRGQRGARHGGVHDVVDPGAAVDRGVSVGVPPPADDPRRQRHHPVQTT